MGNPSLRLSEVLSLLRKLTRDFFFNCISKDALINFLGVILIENAPECRILCVRENPVMEDEWYS